MVNLALIGCGYWGKNYVNTLKDVSWAKLKYVYDIAQPSIVIPKEIIFTDKLEDILKDPEVKGVIIAIPTKYISFTFEWYINKMPFSVFSMVSVLSFPESKKSFRGVKSSFLLFSEWVMSFSYSQESKSFDSCFLKSVKEKPLVLSARRI